MALLLKRIQGHKGVITRMEGEIDTLLRASTIDTERLNTLLNKYDQQRQKIQQLSEELVINSDEKDVEDFVLEYEMLDCQLQSKLDCYRVVLNANKPAVSSRVCRNESETLVKLPTISLPTFDGDVTQWSSFWDRFKASVHSRTDLKPVQKLDYLKSQLTGIAAKLIDPFESTDTSYHNALLLLQETFEDQDRTIRVICNKFLNMKNPTHNVTELLEFKAELESYLRSLESLNCNIDECSFMLVTILTNKLGIKTLEIIQKEAAKDYPNLAEFRKALSKVISHLSSTDYKTGKKSEGKPKISKDKQTNKSNPINQWMKEDIGAYAANIKDDSATDTNKPNQVSSKTSGQTVAISGKDTKNTKKCLFCQEVHLDRNCPYYLNIGSRIERLKELNKCTKCCIKHEGNCKLRKCPRCKNGLHHSFLCPSIEKESYQSVCSVETSQNSDNVALATGIIQLVKGKKVSSC